MKSSQNSQKGGCKLLFVRFGGEWNSSLLSCKKSEEKGCGTLPAADYDGDSVNAPMQLLLGKRRNQKERKFGIKAFTRPLIYEGGKFDERKIIKKKGNKKTA